MIVPPSATGLLSGALGFFFTIAILSYLIGDNIVYRIALHLFVGTAAGYAAVIVIYQVLYPRLITPLFGGDPTAAMFAAVPLILFALLITKFSTRFSFAGSISVAFLLGVGTAVAIGGALTGTLVPQIENTALSLLPVRGQTIFTTFNNIIIVIGTIATLLSFQFWARSLTPAAASGSGISVETVIKNVGQGFVVITLAVVYGGMILSGIAVLSARFSALTGWLSALLP